MSLTLAKQILKLKTKKKGGPMFNKIILTGEIVDTPTVKHVSSKTTVIILPLEVKTKYGPENQEREEILHINAIAFGENKEKLSLSKGDLILIEGRLRESPVKQQELEVVINNLYLLNKKETETPAEKRFEKRFDKKTETTNKTQTQQQKVDTKKHKPESKPNYNKDTYYRTKTQEQTNKQVISYTSKSKYNK